MMNAYEFRTNDVKEIVECWGSSGENTQTRKLIDVLNSIDPATIDYANITIKCKV